MIDRIAKITVCVLAFGAVPASAETWVHVATNPNGSSYVDRDSMTRSGQEVQYWREIRLNQPMTVEGTTYNRIRTLAVAYCAERSTRDIRSSALIDTTILATFDLDGAKRSVAAGSTAERDFTAACDMAR